MNPNIPSTTPELAKCTHTWGVEQNPMLMVWELRHKSDRFEVVCRVTEKDLRHIGTIIDLAEWWITTVHDEEVIKAKA